MNIRRHDGRLAEPRPTAVIEHGANPGLISHSPSKGLMDIAERLLADKQRPRAATPRKSAN